MFVTKENQKSFWNFSEFLIFLNKINSDVELNKQTPNYAMFSKSKGIIGGCNFTHLCQLIKETFGVKLIPSGCIEANFGYLVTFEDGYLDQVEKELAKSTLEEKTKAELLAMALEKGLEVKPTLKKEEIINLLKTEG